VGYRCKQTSAQAVRYRDFDGEWSLEQTFAGWKTIESFWQAELISRMVGRWIIRGRFVSQRIQGLDKDQEKRGKRPYT
jgi:hypothetical protein